MLGAIFYTEHLAKINWTVRCIGRVISFFIYSYGSEVVDLPKVNIHKVGMWELNLGCQIRIPHLLTTKPRTHVVQATQIFFFLTQSHS